jgi:hypothetical protein
VGLYRLFLHLTNSIEQTDQRSCHSSQFSSLHEHDVSNYDKDTSWVCLNLRQLQTFRERLLLFPLAIHWEVMSYMYYRLAYCIVLLYDWHSRSHPRTCNHSLDSIINPPYHHSYSLPISKTQLCCIQNIFCSYTVSCSQSPPIPLPGLVLSCPSS